MSLGDDLTCCGENFVIGAVIVCQDDDIGVVVLLAESLDIADVGALETENCLIVVAHRHDVGVSSLARQRKQQA